MGQMNRDRTSELHYFRWRDYDFVATSQMLDKYVEQCNDGKDPKRPGFDAFPIRTPVARFGPVHVPRQSQPAFHPCPRRIPKPNFFTIP